MGKSILVAQMHGEARSLYYTPPTATDRVEVEAITLGDWTKIIRTLPGQSSQIRSEGINEAFDKNKDLNGVIHVVDFGYTTPRDSSTSAALIKDHNIGTIENLREYNLRAENFEINRIASIIEQSITRQGTPKWVLIAVNKVDIYPNSLDEALAYYHPLGNSPFSSTLKDLQMKFGSNRLPIFVVQTCAHEQDFNWNNATIESHLKKNQQKEKLREYMNTLIGISERFE